MRKMKKMVLILMCLFLLPAATCQMVSAAEDSTNASLYLDNYVAVLYKGARGTGKIDIDFDVTATEYSDYVGVSKIEIYRSDGIKTTIFGSVDNGLLREDALGLAVTYTYSGVSGKSYYAVLTFYAERDGGSGTKTFTTNTVTAP